MSVRKGKIDIAVLRVIINKSWRCHLNGIGHWSFKSGNTGSIPVGATNKIRGNRVK